MSKIQVDKYMRQLEAYKRGLGKTPSWAVWNESDMVLVREKVWDEIKHILPDVPQDEGLYQFFGTQIPNMVIYKTILVRYGAAPKFVEEHELIVNMLRAWRIAPPMHQYQKDIEEWVSGADIPSWVSSGGKGVLYVNQVTYQDIVHSFVKTGDKPGGDFEKLTPYDKITIQGFNILPESLRNIVEQIDEKHK